MKIVDVKTYPVVYPVKDPFSNGMRTTRQRPFGIVEVITDSGLSGWGEGTGVPARRALESQVIGRSPFDYEVIWEGLQLAGTDIGAISGVDIALWDLMGKALDKPVYQLLGGAFRSQVQAYATGLFRRERSDPTAALVEEARGYVDQGFKAMKMKVGFGPDYDIKNVAAVRRAIGDDILFAVDANCAYERGSAIAVGQRLVENNLLWFEEPISSDDVEGYIEIRRALNVRVSGAEQLRGGRLAIGRPSLRLRFDASIVGSQWQPRQRDHAKLGERLAGVGLDLEPNTEARLGLPDLSHFFAGIAGDHAASRGRSRRRRLRKRVGRSVRKFAPRVFTPRRSSIAVKLCLVKGALFNVSPVPLRPTTKP